MSWEVSSMPSKRSFFNRTLFRKNLSRFWPLWGGVSLVGSMAPLYILLALLGGRGPYSPEPWEFASALYTTATFFLPAAIAAYAVLCAMTAWGYLYDGRAVGMMHALPVDRTCIFVTSTLSGLAALLIPFFVVGGFSCLIALIWGFLDLTAVVMTTLTVLLLALTFYGLATFSAMLTGHILALPVLYALLNFLAPLLEALVIGQSQQFLVGVGADEFGRSIFLSPLFQIYTCFRPNVEKVDGTPVYHLTGLWVVALYALAGLALLAVSWLLFRRRHSERAGSVVAFSWLRPVFRYGVSLLSALTLGRLVYELMWASLFQHGGYADLLPMCVCMAAGGALGYYVASMLLEKSLRVFKGSWPGLAAVCAGAALLCVLTSLDIFGAERWTPDPEEVESVHLGDYSMGFTFYSEDDPQMVEQVVDIHRAIVEDRDYIRDEEPEEYRRGECVSRYISLRYQLKNGREVRRFYNLWVTAARVARPDTYDSRLAALYSAPETIRERAALPKGAELQSVYVYNYASEQPRDGMSLDENDLVYGAILRDLEEGNIPGCDPLREGSGQYADLHVELEYRLWHSQESAYEYGYKDVPIYPSMTNTLRALTGLDYVSEAQLALWDEELEQEAALLAEEGGIPAASVARP